MKQTLNLGDKVRVMDQGLLMLQKFAPPGSKPNNVGKVSAIMEDDYYEIEFPIGDDNPDEHSQVAPYHESVIQKLP